MIKILVAITIGSIFMVLIDLLSARVTSSMLAIPLSVFVGACIAGCIAEKRAGLIGLSVGFVNVLISLILFLIYGDVKLFHEGGYTPYDVLAMPMSSSLICGLLGGILSGVLKINMPIFINNLKNV
jgi:hypothetical protein